MKKIAACAFGAAVLWAALLGLAAITDPGQPGHDAGRGQVLDCTAVRP